jgi:hypothetical protein
MTIILAGDIEEAGRILTDACFGGAKASGWHNDLKTGQPRTKEQNDELFRRGSRFVTANYRKRWKATANASLTNIFRQGYLQKWNWLMRSFASSI